MNDARIVSLRETFGNVLHDAQEFREVFVFVANLVAQRHAIDVLHCDEVEIIHCSDLVDVRDVWVIERRGRRGFLFEAPHSILVRSEVSRQDFQRDFAIQTRVLREVNFAHAARTEEGANLVATELGLGRKSHAKEKVL